MRRILLQFVAVITLALGPPLVLAESIFEFGGHTYKIISEPATWEEASAKAAEMQLAGKQGYLARINSARENAVILEAVMAHLTEEELGATIAEDGSDTAFVWLGGSDSAQEGKWVWSDNGDQFWEGDFNGSPVGGFFTNWGVQPDSASGTEDALAMGLGDWPEPFFDLGAAGQWNDLDGDTAMAYVIEFSSVTDLRLVIEEPTAGGIHSGIGMVRGWAVSSNAIERVEVFVNDEYQFDIPHGGFRPDVGNIFEEIENSDNSGYASAVNFGGLEAGEHTVTVRVTDTFGSIKERGADFTVTKFHKGFISADDAIELGWTAISGLGKSIKIRGAKVDGEYYDISLEWRTATQGFEITSIEKR